MYLLRISFHDKKAAKRPYRPASQVATQMPTYYNFLIINRGNKKYMRKSVSYTIKIIQQVRLKS